MKRTNAGLDRPRRGQGDAMTETTTSAAPSGTVQAIVRLCALCGQPATHRRSYVYGDATWRCLPCAMRDNKGYGGPISYKIKKPNEKVEAPK